MRGSIYLKTLRDLRWATIAWSVGVAAIAAVSVLMYPTLQRMEGLVAFLDGLPEVFKAMIGDVSAMARLEGFLHVKLFDPLPLLLAVYGISHGAQMLAGEVEHKHLDLLLARPIRRWRVVVAKSLAVMTGLVVIVAVTAVCIVICARAIDAQPPLGHLVVATLNGLPLTGVFTALALLGSSLASRPRAAGFTAGAIMVASYVLETMRLMSPALAWFRPVSLFWYQKASYPLEGAPDLAAVGLLIALTVGLIVAACLAWERRDLAA
jgi:ABC-2 type transport system permease protein